MKIAACLYGFLRDFSQHCTSLRENILEEHDMDMFGYFPLERSEDDLRQTPNGALKKVYGHENIEKLRWILGKPGNMKCLGEDLYESSIEYVENFEIGQEEGQVPPGNTLICHHLAVNGNEFHRSNYVDASFDHICSSYCGHNPRYGSADYDDEEFEYQNIIKSYKS